MFSRMPEQMNPYANQTKKFNSSLATDYNWFVAETATAFLCRLLNSEPNVLDA